MSRTFQFTTSDDIGAEIEQYIWGKFGTTPPKAIGSMVLSGMSKNPLTEQQKARIFLKYGDKAIGCKE